MILFVGMQEDGFFVPEVAENFNEEVFFLGYTPDLPAAFAEITAEKYSAVIIDAAHITTPSDLIVDTVDRIIQAINPRVVIMAKGYNPRAKLISDLQQMGLKDFVLGASLSEQKEEIEKALRGENDNDVDVEEYFSSLDVNVEPDEPVSQIRGARGYKTVGVLGCMHRIGATTQSLQIVKYLQLIGKKACYIELNNNNYVRQLVMYYSDGLKINDDLGKISYQGIDMFYQQNLISEILSLDYDYFVYDFGAFTGKNFPLVSFLEKNIRVVVGGAKPNEMSEMQPVLRQISESNINYIFSFTDESEHKDILSAMEEKSLTTHFAGYATDPFAFLSYAKETYEKMFDENGNEPSKKKRGFFARRRKNGKI